jgi:hypothetical protein
VLVLAGVLSPPVLPGVAAVLPKPLPLSARLLERGEFPGFTMEAPISYTAKKWIALDTSLTATQARAEVARLTREGFRGLLAQFLDSALGPQTGLCFVMQLGSPASARAELAAEVREAKSKGHAPETFRVSAIPGAVGFRRRPWRGPVGGRRREHCLRRRLVLLPGR